jgi:hypothetical protein
VNPEHALLVVIARSAGYFAVAELKTTRHRSWTLQTRYRTEYYKTHGTVNAKLYSLSHTDVLSACARLEAVPIDDLTVRLDLIKKLRTQLGIE